MKKFKKVCLWSVGIFVGLIILIAILPSSKSSKEIQKIVERVDARGNQRIVDAITVRTTDELKVNYPNTHLRKVEIEGKRIGVYLDLQLVPQSAEWLKSEGLSWVRYLIGAPLYDESGDVVRCVYETGYDLVVYLWTWDDPPLGEEVIPWGHARIATSDGQFDFGKVWLEGKWLDGRGMELLK